MRPNSHSDLPLGPSRDCIRQSANLQTPRHRRSKSRDSPPPRRKASAESHRPAPELRRACHVRLRILLRSGRARNEPRVATRERQRLRLRGADAPSRHVASHSSEVYCPQLGCGPSFQVPVPQAQLRADPRLHSSARPSPHPTPSRASPDDDSHSTTTDGSCLEAGFSPLTACPGRQPRIRSAPVSCPAAASSGSAAFERARSASLHRAAHSRGKPTTRPSVQPTPLRHQAFCKGSSPP